MAKKKNNTESTMSIDDIDAHIISKYGDVFLSANSIMNEPNVVIPFSPAVDLILGGGIMEGSFVIMSGRPKSGKTSSALDFAGTAQRTEYVNDLCPNGRHIYFFNVEGRIKGRDLKGITNLDKSDDKLTIISSKPGNILNAEDFLEILENYVHTKPGAIFIIDSLSQLCSSSRRAEPVGNRFRDDVPLMLAGLTKKLSGILPINKSILIGITHLYSNQDPKSKVKWVEASGQKIQYAADVKLRVTHFTPHIYKENQVGQIIHWVCEVSGIGAPGGKSDSLLRYGHGIDKEWELMNYGSGIGLFDKAGSWYTFGDERVQGQDNACQFLRDNPELYDELYVKFRQAMGLC
jgi:recombination protein RecA